MFKIQKSQAGQTIAEMLFNIQKIMIDLAPSIAQGTASSITWANKEDIFAFHGRI